MASDKKPSMYSNRGKIGSAEELEAYGVWVKSEPQDFTASLAEAAANFNADALPYEDDFDAGFDDVGMGADFDLLGSDLNIPEISVDDDTGSFDEGLRGSEEASSQLLMKISGELSSIRSELNTLKKEFAELRGEDASEADAAAETVAGESALGGDAMENFFNSADFPTDEEMGFDPGREADEAALKELDAQNEAEEIHINFENLGIDLDSGLAEEETSADASADAAQDELPPLEADDDDFAMPSFDALSFEEASPSGLDELEVPSLEADEQGFAEELVPLEGEDDELRALRLEGAESLSPPPDNADYLEEDPFALNNADLESSTFEPPSLSESADALVFGDSISDETAAAEATVDETSVSETSVSETEVTASEASPGEEGVDLAFEDLSFDEAGFDLGLDDFAAEPAPAPPVEEPALAEKAGDETFFDTGSLELPSAAAEEEIDIGLDEPLPDVESMDLSDAVIDEPNLSEEIVEPPLEEPVLGDISFEDEISLDMDGFETELDIKIDEPAAEPALDDKPDDLPSDLDLELAAKPDDLEMDFELDEADDFAAADLEADLDSVVAEPKDTGKPADKVADKVAVPSSGIISDIDDSVIPEGLEKNAKEADPSLDDDLEAFADGELAIADDDRTDSFDAVAEAEEDGGEFAAIPPALKTELKNVLSYMDHLLESLPEDKIEEFAQSEYFDKYKKIFKELGLV